MRRNIRTALAAAGTIAASLTLASCGHHPRPVAAIRPVPIAAAPAPIGPAPEGPTSAMVWTLRSGLNVAALSCRGEGRQPVAAGYARLLTRHKALLAATYTLEQGRQGAGGFDHAQTRVYNTFSNQVSAPYFCEVARAVAQRANELDSAALAAEAPQLLAHLQVALRLPPQFRNR
jgi:hypothetical protein